MNPNHEQFDNLRKVLIIKRYEVPPPGYFNHFADKIVARIESENLIMEHSWWRRFLNGFDARPILASAYTIGLGGVLLIGLSLVGLYEQERSEPLASGNSPLPLDPNGGTQLASETEPLGAPTQFRSSINPVISAEVPSSLFKTPSIYGTAASMNTVFGVRPASYSHYGAN